MKKWVILSLILVSSIIEIGEARQETPSTVPADLSTFTITVKDADCPSKPVLYKLFNFARDYSTTPTLTFSATDPEGDQIEYRIFWSQSFAFAAPVIDSATTALYPSGATASFTFPSALVDGRTYWWKVKGRDPLGSNSWGQFSDVWGFTIGKSLPTNTCSWFQTKGSQFNFDAFTGAAVVQGDSVVLAPPSSGRDTLINENFNAAASLPAGWTTVNGGGNTVVWLVGTNASATAPPSFGTYYAYCLYPAPPGTEPADNDDIVSPAKRINALANNLYLKYGWGMDAYQAGDSLTTWVRFFSAGVWGAWINLAKKTADGTGTDSLNLASYLPRDSIQVRWRYTSPGTENSQDGTIDNVLLVDIYNLPNTSGKVTGTSVVYKDLSASYPLMPRTGWGKVFYRKSLATDSIGIQVEYLAGGVWALVPDAVLPGNAVGFYSTGVYDSVYVNDLDTLTYDTLRLVGNLYCSGTKASANPALLDWELGNLSGIIIIIGVGETAGRSTPDAGRLEVYPNPFFHRMEIRYMIQDTRYTIKDESQKLKAENSRISLKIYNSTGQLVKSFLLPTAYSLLPTAVSWDGTDDTGHRLPSGVYLVRLEVGDFNKVEKVILLR